MIRHTLLCILLHFSIAHASDWRQCWGQEYLYYDEACCNTQDQLTDTQFHCLVDLPQLANYTDLKETLHEQLDALNTCVQGVPASPASYSMTNENEACVTDGEYIQFTDAETGGVTSSPITEAQCSQTTLNAMADGGVCFSSYKSLLDVHTEADCSGTWKTGTVTGEF